MIFYAPYGFNHYFKSFIHVYPPDALLIIAPLACKVRHPIPVSSSLHQLRTPRRTR